MSKKTILLPILCAVSLTLAGCAADGQRYRADTYSTSGVNRAQEVTTVEILAINPAKVAVDNSSAGSRARTTGAILGAIAGALVGPGGRLTNTHRRCVAPAPAPWWAALRATPPRGRARPRTSTACS